MSQDPYERVQAFLSETKFDPLALLLDLTPLLPDSMVEQAISLAQAADNIVLQGLLIEELAKRLPNEKDRIELTNQYQLPPGIGVEDLSTPEGKQAKALIAQLPEDQRYGVFDQLFLAIKMGVGRDDSTRYSKIRRPPESVSGKDDGGFTLGEPPVNAGGGEAVDAGFEAVDDGFEALPTPKPQTMPEGLDAAEPEPATDGLDGRTESPDLVNLGFSHKDVADKKVQKTE